MERVAHWSPALRSDLFRGTATRTGMPPAVVEKDFWVCWTLGRIFADSRLAKKLLFKGGTSLSKVFGLIQRFSEDIDLILDWRELTGEDPAAARSKTSQARLNASIQAGSRDYLKQVLTPLLADILGPVATASISAADPDVIVIRYPVGFADAYCKPEIRLEVGPLAIWVPNVGRTVASYAAQEFPHLFSTPDTQVMVVKAERTFWEKATILHHESNRPISSPQPPRYSRHYYDMAMMAGADIKGSALSDLALLESVVQSKMRFYPRPWARYELAKPGSLQLVPPEHIRAIIERDYAEMRHMIFGRVPSLGEIMATIRDLQDEINGIR